MIEWHMISCEYPPQVGGVSSYVDRIAAGLGRAGHRVHVWCPPAEGRRPEPEGVTVHGALGRFAPSDLREATRLLDRFPSPRRLLIQWVPHGYGYRSMNVGFCRWVLQRARSGDTVDLMVHEPYLAFAGNWKQRGAAAVHRLMTVMLLRAARRVWVSTPAWKEALEPFAPARPLGFDWLPIPSPIEAIDDARGVRVLRERCAPNGEQIVGHFGLYSRLTSLPAAHVLVRALEELPDTVALLIGQGSGRLRDDLVAARPMLERRVHAAGVLEPDDLSRALQACDVLVQPYPEGLTSRRTTTMAALAHGKAIVSNDGPATEPLWHQSGALTLITGSDTAAMAQAVADLLSDQATRTALGARARELYDARFDTRHTIEALEASCSSRKTFRATDPSSVEAALAPFSSESRRRPG